MSFFETLTALVVKDMMDAVSEAKRSQTESANRYEEEKLNEKIRVLTLGEKCLNAQSKILKLFEQISIGLGAEHQILLSHYDYFAKALIAYPYFAVLEEQGFPDDNQKMFLSYLRNNENSFSGNDIINGITYKDNQNACAVAIKSFMDINQDTVAPFWEYLIHSEVAGIYGLTKKLITLEIEIMKLFLKMRVSGNDFVDSKQFTNDILYWFNECKENIILQEDGVAASDATIETYYSIAMQAETKYVPPKSKKVLFENVYLYTNTYERPLVEKSIIEVTGLKADVVKKIIDDNNPILDGLEECNAVGLVSVLKKLNIETCIEDSWTELNKEQWNYADYSKAKQEKTERKAKKVKKTFNVLAIIFTILSTMWGVLGIMEETFIYISVLAFFFNIIIMFAYNFSKYYETYEIRGVEFKQLFRRFSLPIVLYLIHIVLGIVFIILNVVNDNMYIIGMCVLLIVFLSGLLFLITYIKDRKKNKKETL